MRPHRALLAVLACAAISLPVLAATPAPCPDGATWQGRPPPLGDGYQCVRTRADGQLERHGWAVFYHPVSQARLEECEYQDGVRDGHCTFYSEQGKLRERGTFTRGLRTGAWWYWSLPTPHGPRDTLILPLADPAAASERRRDVEAFLLDVGASHSEAPALGEAILQYVDRGGRERRQICGEQICIAPGNIPDEPIFVGLGVTPEQTARDRKLLVDYTAKARLRVRAEERAAKKEAARLAAEQRRIEREAAASDDDDADDVVETRDCCRYCDAGKPCGNSCIAAWKTCHKGRGCAC